MLALPVWMRTNVVVIAADGNQYVNHVSLRGTWQAPSSAGGSSQPLETALAPQATAIPPGTSGGAGPFRRVYSDSAAGDNYPGGFTGLFGDVSVPCNGANLSVSDLSGSHDDGYTYIEGLDDSNNNFQVGYEYNAANQTLVQYFNLHDANGWQSVGSGSQRYPCGAYHATTGFYTLGAHLVALFWSSTAPNTRPFTITHELPSTIGWSATDSAARVARMTSLAQTTSNFTDGEYFGVAQGPKATTAPLIGWSRSSLVKCRKSSGFRGDSCTLSSVDTSGVGFHYQNYPADNGGVSTPADSLQNGNHTILVDFSSNGREVDGIILPSAAPATPAPATPAPATPAPATPAPATPAPATPAPATPAPATPAPATPTPAATLPPISG